MSKTRFIFGKIVSWTMFPFFVVTCFAFATLKTVTDLLEKFIDKWSDWNDYVILGETPKKKEVLWLRK